MGRERERGRSGDTGEYEGFAKRGLRLGCLARAVPGGMVEAGGRARGMAGDGGESAESQEGEFGAEVSAFLSGAACICVCMCVYVCARPRSCRRL